MAKLSISEAARQWNIARSTLHRAIQAGTVSVDNGKNGRKTIDRSEMLRVYGEPRNVSKVIHQDSLIQAKDALIQQLKTENEYLREQVKHLNDDLRAIRKPIFQKLLPWIRSE